MKARIREDLVREGLLPPIQAMNRSGYLVNTHLPARLMKTVFNSRQPAKWDNLQFNTAISDPKSGKIYRINSIDLDFID